MAAPTLDQSDTGQLGAQLNSEQYSQYVEDGYVVVPDLLNHDEIEDFLARGRTPVPENGDALFRHKNEEPFRYLATHPRVVSIVGQLLQGPPLVVQSMLLDKPASGGRGISLHQDTHHIETEPNTLMACWIALTDTDGDNGGLCVVPGSHKGGLLGTHLNENEAEHAKWEREHLMRDRSGREWTQGFYAFEIDGLDPGAVRQLTVPRGAGVFFNGLTIHGSYANKSADRPRIAFATHYVREGTWVLRADLQDLMPASR